MLRKIVFFIAEEKQICAIEQMKRNFGQNGEMIVVSGAFEAGKETAYNKESTLFVTDEEEALAALKR
ncbi:MAG: hypothetical protein GX235_03700, partial [Clostridiales bacterium]|nr:hypothetical protein [Clostridiales bacterium]